MCVSHEAAVVELFVPRVMQCGILGCDGCLSCMAPMWGCRCAGGWIVVYWGVTVVSHLGGTCVGASACAQGNEVRCIGGVMGVRLGWHLYGTVCVRGDDVWCIGV